MYIDVGAGKFHDICLVELVARHEVGAEEVDRFFGDVWWYATIHFLKCLDGFMDRFDIHRDSGTRFQLRWNLRCRWHSIFVLETELDPLHPFIFCT